MSRIHVFNKAYNHFTNGGDGIVYLYKSGIEWDYSIGEKLTQSVAIGTKEYKITCIDDLNNCK